MFLVVGIKILGGHPLIRAEFGAWLEHAENLAVDFLQLRAINARSAIDPIEYTIQTTQGAQID